MMELDILVRDFAAGLQRADGLAPQWVSSSGRQYQPGIGPHAENRAVALVAQQMRTHDAALYNFAGPVNYPGSRLKCDLGVGDPLLWAIEVKMARAFGDNGKLDDTWLKDLLSPYEADHSAFTDGLKLRSSSFACRRAVLVYGFDYDRRPLSLVLDTLDLLLRRQGPVGQRAEASFRDLIHTVHRRGQVVAWEVLPS